MADIYEYLGLVEAGKPLTVTLKGGKALSLAPVVLVLRGRGGEIPALPPPDQGEGIAPEIRQASQGYAGVGIPGGPFFEEFSSPVSF